MCPISSSVRGSSKYRPAPPARGPWSPTQTVTIRPRLSKVTEAQSAEWNADRRWTPLPSGPGRTFASVWNASTCRFERSFGAMCGCRGGCATYTGAFVDASNEYVIPGLVEMHAHLDDGYGGNFGKVWLAYGITSVRIPSIN